MQSVLVHIVSDLGPIGAWSYLNGKLAHYYPTSLDQQIPSRGRTVMAARGVTTVPDWFAQIAACSPCSDTYHAVDVADGVSLPAVVAECRRAWNQHS